MRDFGKKILENKCDGGGQSGTALSDYLSTVRLGKKVMFCARKPTPPTPWMEDVKVHKLIY